MGTQDFDDFFTSLKIPLVHPDMVKKLEMPVTANELSVAIASVQGAKCPGLISYPIEFYRKFQHKLACVLIDMLHESFASLNLHLIKLPSLLSLKRTKIL